MKDNQPHPASRPGWPSPPGRVKAAAVLPVGSGDRTGGCSQVPSGESTGHRGCSKLGSAERGLGRLLAGGVTRRALPRKVPAATCRGQHLRQRPMLRGDPQPQGWLRLHGLAGCGARTSWPRDVAPSPARLPALRCHSYSEIRQCFQALPCLKAAGSARLDNTTAPPNLLEQASLAGASTLL